MKHTSIVLSLLFSLLFVSNKATAQLGIKAGVNFSSLQFFDENFDDFNEEFITGYQIGAVYHVGLGNKLSFQPEAAFHTLGGQINNELLGDIERNYNYLILNGLLNYNLIGNNDGLSLRITGGVFGGYALNATATSTSGGATEKTDIDFEEEGFDRSNVGYVVGVGVKLNDFLVSLRASFGVTEIGSIESAFGNGATTYKTREFSLVGAYLF